MKNRYSQSIIAASILIICALILCIVTFDIQKNAMYGSEDAHLQQLAQSIDYNLTSTLSYAQKALQSLNADYNINVAQRDWLKSGDSEELLNLMRDSMAAKELSSKALLVIKNSEVVLSTVDNTVLSSEGFVADGNLLPCRTESGELTLLLFTNENSRSISYGMLIDLNSLYNNIVGNELAEENWILLLDSNSQIVLHHQSSRVLVDPIDAVTGATCGPRGIEILQTIQNDGVTSSDSYNYWDAENKVKHAARLLVIPSEKTQNAFFAVGIASRIDTKLSAMKRSFTVYVFAISLFMAGLFIIAWVARKHLIQSREQMLELEILKEKNKEMEVLANKRAQMAHLDRLETIGVMTSKISHEFNNLLTPIMGCSILALEQLPEDEDKVAGYIEQIYNASTKAKSLVSRLSDLSRKNSAETFSELNLKRVIENAVESTEPARPRAVECSKELADNLIISGNELQLSQMFLNMLLNAYQAVDEEKGRVKITAAQNGEFAEIHLQDNGPGIAKENAERIFDPFFTTKASGLGTGLGLAICKQAVEDHKGTIELNLEYTEGCDFIIRLPLLRGTSFDEDTEAADSK